MTAPAPSARRPGRAMLARIVRTREASTSTDLVLAVVRAALTWIFIYYGAGKLFGWFGGPGLHQSALFFANIAHLRPGTFFAVVGGVVEFAGAIGLALGLGTRVAGLALCGDMVVAVVTVTGKYGINSQSATPGYELNLALGVLALVVVVLGAGRFSLDALVERRVTAGEP